MRGYGAERSPVIVAVDECCVGVGAGPCNSRHGIGWICAGVDRVLGRAGLDVIKT